MQIAGTGKKKLSLFSTLHVENDVILDWFCRRDGSVPFTPLLSRVLREGETGFNEVSFEKVPSRQQVLFVEP